MSRDALLHDEIDQDEAMQAEAKELVAQVTRATVAAGVKAKLPVREIIARVGADVTEALTDLTTKAMQAGAARVRRR